jgi:hypothetical protein
MSLLSRLFLFVLLLSPVALATDDDVAEVAEESQPTTESTDVTESEDPAADEANSDSDLDDEVQLLLRHYERVQAAREAAGEDRETLLEHVRIETLNTPRGGRNEQACREAIARVAREQGVRLNIEQVLEKLCSGEEGTARVSIVKPNATGERSEFSFRLTLQGGLTEGGATSFIQGSAITQFEGKWWNAQNQLLHTFTLSSQGEYRAADGAPDQHRVLGEAAYGYLLGTDNSGNDVVIHAQVNGARDTNRGLSGEFRGTGGLFYRHTFNGNDKFTFRVGLDFGYQRTHFRGSTDGMTPGRQIDLMIGQPELQFQAPALDDALLFRVKAFFQLPIFAAVATGPDRTDEWLDMDQYRVGAEGVAQARVTDHLSFTATLRYTRIEAAPEGTDPNEFVVLVGGTVQTN